MKKTALLITICLFCATTWAQDTTTHLPKFRITKGVLSTKYELGDKDVDAKQVRIHLEKHSPESYYQWRKAESATTTAAVLLVVGLGCGIGALVSSDQTTQIALYSAAVGFVAGGFIADFGSKARMERARDGYNRAAGY